MLRHGAADTESPMREAHAPQNKNYFVVRRAEGEATNGREPQAKHTQSMNKQCLGCIVRPNV